MEEKTEKVKLIDYPQGFKSRLYNGRAFAIDGEVFEVYGAKDPKHGKPRFMVRGLGILGIVEQEGDAQKGAEEHEQQIEDGEGHAVL